MNLLECPKDGPEFRKGSDMGYEMKGKIDTWPRFLLVDQLYPFDCEGTVTKVIMFAGGDDLIDRTYDDTGSIKVRS